MCQINFYSWTENVAYHDYERQQELIAALKRRVVIMGNDDDTFERF